MRPILAPVLALMLLFSAGAWAQEFRATLVGRVADPSGAPVPGASLVATQVETNMQYRAVTTETGDYTLPFLPPGRYRLEVERTGFRTYVRDGISLRVQDRVRVDVALVLGAQAESVTVTAETPLLDASSASVGQVVSRQTIEDIPLNGRNGYNLMLTVPGVMTTARDNSISFMRYTAAGDTGGIASMSMSGAPSAYNEYLLDGVPTTSDNNAVDYVPSVEATQEFKLQTNSFDAEFGRFLGGVLNASTKSGTNTVHGTAFEFMRNSVFNARDFFAAKKPQFAYNQFGASVSGPVYIPHIYNGKNRTFFFVLYDGSREGVPRSFVSTVPTDLERAGDFSQTFTRVAGQATPVTIYDPSTTRLVGNAYVRDPFPGNVIPADRQNPVAKALLGIYPRPSATGDAITHISNYPLSYKDPVLDNGVIFKVDHQFSSRHQMFVRYFWRHFYVRGGGEFLSGATSRGVNRYSPGVALDHTFALNPTTVLDFRYGLSRYRAVAISDSYGFDASTLGWPSSLVGTIDRPAIPQVTASGYTGFGSFNKDASAGDTHFARVSMFKQKERHALRAGFGARLYRHTSGPGGTNPGAYAFDGGFTRGPNPQVASSVAGNSVASMLLGLGASGSMTYASSLARQIPYYEMYLQDDIRLTPKLTINVGLRYEWEGAQTERYNRLNRGFDVTVASPIEAQAIAKYTASPIPELPASQFRVKGGLLFTGENGSPRALTNIDRNNVSPRVGFAYSLTPKTVIRGGYGHFYGPTTPEGASGQVGGALSLPSYGFSSTTSWITTVNGVTPVDVLSNPFPNGITPPVGSSQALLTNIGQAVSVFNVSRQQLWTQQFQFGIQRQLPGQILVETAYSGTRTNDSPVSVALNATPREIQVQARQNFINTKRNMLSDSVANPFFGLINAGSLSLANTTRGQLLLPYPQFTGVTMMSMNIGSTKYDSLQAKVTKRFSKGLSFLAAYTLSKLTEETSYLNANDPQLTRRLSAYDAPQRFVVSGSYRLPFGKNGMFFSNAKGLPGKLVEGWQANAVYTAQSGVPITLSSGESLGRSAFLPKDQRTRQRWFDTSAFRLRETLEFVGTAALPDVRTHGSNNFDLSLYKDTQILESLKLQFRAESFNLFNRVAFGAPNSTVGSASFGVITSQVNFSRQLQFAVKLLW
ncbi:MAG TPA: TonB-dependent receptor [Bryobacteraceae bacterium]|nr:TonB-dependent receptor [Bryobacteraceae bacterium]